MEISDAPPAVNKSPLAFSSVREYEVEKLLTAMKF